MTFLCVSQIDDIFGGSSTSTGVNGKENGSSTAPSQPSRVSPAHHRHCTETHTDYTVCVHSSLLMPGQFFVVEIVRTFSNWTRTTLERYVLNLYDLNLTIYHITPNSRRLLFLGSCFIPLFFLCFRCLWLWRRNSAWLRSRSKRPNWGTSNLWLHRALNLRQHPHLHRYKMEFDL